MLDTQVEEIKNYRRRERILNEKEFGFNKKILQEIMEAPPQTYLEQESLFN